jgi:pimeloyl-ACP methyl ester carboxylesterase
MEAKLPSAQTSSNAGGESVRNVVLVHGAYADGSSWLDVIGFLQRAGLTATAVQNPLVSLADDVAHTRYVLDLQDGAMILVGHSFAGTVITEAGTDSSVAGLVYIVARAPDVDEDHAALAKEFPRLQPTRDSSSTTGSGH